MRKSETKHVNGMKDPLHLDRKKNKKAFFYLFSQVFINILQNSTLVGSGKRAMAFTCQKHSTLALLSFDPLIYHQ